jgi:HTH-type transcriptional regulator, sugar sensing transcriptional regulator
MTTQNNDLILALKGAGLNKNEATIYLTCLELGPSSIWDIAKKSGIKRPTCYVILDELTWKGLASSTFDGKRTIYSVDSPKQLLRTVERRQERLTQSLSQLEAVASKSPQKPVVRLYEGVQGVMEAYNNTLDRPKGSEILIYGTALVEVNYKEFINDYIANRVKKGISTRVILADTPENRQIATRNSGELRETRFLPEEQFNPTVEVNISGDSIAYIAHSETEPFATVIENATLAQEEKQRFNLLWNSAQG